MNNYFIENKETGKKELHFDKSVYVSLDEALKKEIKSAFLWGRHSGCWISREKWPNFYKCNRVIEKLSDILEDGGTTGERLSFEEQQEKKIERAEARAEHYDYKSAAAEKNAENLQSPINKMHGDIAFFTQPNINTSSGRAFTRRRNAMWASFEKGFEEFKKSEYYQTRAEAARNTAREAKKPDIPFCERRIKEANSGLKKLLSYIKEAEKKIERIEAGEVLKNYKNEIITVEMLEKDIDYDNERADALFSKLAYYQNIIDEAGGIKFSKKDLKPGDKIFIRRFRGEVVTVVSAGPSYVTYRTNDNFTLKITYGEVVSIVEKAPEGKIEHPFKVGDTFTLEKWTGEKYVPIVCTITKISPDRVTVKPGEDRAKSLKPYKTYGGDWAIHVFDGMNGNYYKKG
jgi:hypothetical protein